MISILNALLNAARAMLDTAKSGCTVVRRVGALALILTACVVLTPAMVGCTTKEPRQKTGKPEVDHRKDGNLELNASKPAGGAAEAAASTPAPGALPPDLDKWQGWPQYRGTPDHNNFRDVQDRIGVPKVLWKMERAGLPAVVGDEVYTGGESLRLANLETGTVKASWKGEEMTEAFNFFGTPVVLDDRVIAHTRDGRVYALDRSLGKIWWTTEVKGLGSFSGVTNGAEYVVSAGARLVALEVSDGSVRWTRKFSRLFPVNMTPAIAEGKVLFGTASGHFYAVDLQTGEEIWNHEGMNPFGWTDPVAAFGKVYVGDRGGVVNTLDLETGTEVWSRVSGATGLSEPCVTPASVLVGFSRVVVPFDAATGGDDPMGRTFRTGLNPFGSPTLVGDTLYFGNLDGHLYAFDFEAGTFKWAFEIHEGQQVLDFVYHKGVLLLQTTEGLYALGNDPDRSTLPLDFVLSLNGDE